MYRSESMKQAQHIQLVTIAGRENEAASIESFLRDNGQPVRMHWLQPNDDLEERLGTLFPDLIFCEAHDSNRRDYVLHCCNKVAPEVPVLLLVNEINSDAVTTALRKRARDAVCPEYLEHLQAVYLRELAAAKLESNLREANHELQSLRARLDSLVAVSQLAVAHVQDGILLDVSEDFCELFGHELPEDLEGEPFLELIAEEERGRLKKLLNRCAAGKVKEQDLESIGLSAKDESFALLLRVATVDTQDGNAVEIQAKRAELPATVAVDQAPATATAPQPAAEGTKPAAAAKATEAEAQSDVDAAVEASIDEKLTQQLIDAVQAGRLESRTSQFISLDGQVSNFFDLALELRTENNKLISLPPNNRASGKILLELDAYLFDAMLKQFAEQAEDDTAPCTLLMPLHAASLAEIDSLKQRIASDCAPAFKAGHKLVLSLAELPFSREPERTRKLVDGLRPLGVQFAVENARATAATLQVLELVKPDYVCLDRSATQMLISQGGEHAELGKIMQLSRDGSSQIVAFPLQDAHSMAMLWQRGINMVRGSVPQHLAAA